MVSVIIPVYNGAEFLEECLRSITNQTYRDLEIIVIDDGSTDCSYEICKEWASKDGRIKVISKENNGAGMARNTGIDNAHGEYICFCDSDDFLAEDAIEKAYQRIVTSGAEIVIFGFNNINVHGEVVSKVVPAMENTNYKGEDIQKEFLPELIAPNPKGDGKRRLYMSNWTLFCSMETINRSGWRFASEREVYSEDVYSLLELFMKVNHVTVLPEALYYYRKNDSSISRVYKPNRYAEIRDFYIKTKALGEKLGCSSEILRRLSNPYLSFTIAAIKQEMYADITRNSKQEIINELLNDDVLQSVLSENEEHRKKIARMFLFWAMRHRLVFLCYWLFQLQVAKDMCKKERRM